MRYEFKEDDAWEFAKAINAKVHKSGDELVFEQCPYCGEYTQKKDNKNKFAINLRTGQFNCFRASCGAKGNMITLSRAFNWALPGYADEYYNQRKTYKQFPAVRPVVTDKAIEYLKTRGISEEVTRQYEITSDKNNPNLIVFPFYDENNVLQLIKYRDTTATKENGKSKEFSVKDCKPILFGMNHCDPDKENGTLIMTEGQIDSLSVAEAGYQNVVSVPNGANGFTWIPYCWDFLRQFKRLIVFGDYERGHISLLDMMTGQFYGEVLHVKPEDYLDCKDANDILRKYDAAHVVGCITNAVPVENKKFVRMSDVVSRPISTMEKISTGFDSLNRTLGGFYFGQLIILTGERGEGKSTLSNQFALMAVNAGIKTFIYSGELPNGSLRDWVDHQAAGPRYIREHANSYGDMTYTVAPEALEKISDWYRDYLWIYQNQFLEDLDSEVEQNVVDLIEEAARDGFRFIVVDNLMTALDDDMRIDLYRAQTKFVKQLVRIAKTRDIIIVLVAHQRKNQGTASRTADDVAGSGNITNLADIVMTFGKPRKPDEVEHDREIRIQKNRLTGRLGQMIPIWFDEASKRVRDETSGFGWAFKWEDGENIWTKAEEEVFT